MSLNSQVTSVNSTSLQKYFAGHFGLFVSFRFYMIAGLNTGKKKNLTVLSRNQGNGKLQKLSMVGIEGQA